MVDRGDGEPEADVDALVRRLRELTGECIETYVGIGKHAIRAASGDDDARSSFFRDSWMAWAGLGGKVVEATYISATLADHASRLRRDA